MSISQKEDIYEFLSQAVDTEISRIQQIKENRKLQVQVGHPAVEKLVPS